MKKALKFIFSFISAIIIMLVSVPILLSMLLQVSYIQNYAVDKVTDILSKKAKTTMSISHIDIEFFSKVVIDQVYIEDHRGDTMIYVGKLKVGIDGINFINGKISLGIVEVIDGQCNLYKDSTGIMNVQRVFDNFQPEVPPTDQPDFRMSTRELNLTNFHFKLDDVTVEPQQHGINFKQMDLNKIQFQARDINIYNYDISLAIENMSFVDRSGFYLQHLSSPQCGVNESGMRFEKLRLETERSLLQFGHVYLLYDTWYAYNDFVNDVILDVEILPSKLSYRTLSYFISQSGKIPTTIEFEGRVRGAIPSLHGYFSRLKSHDTNMNVAFSVVGLPDITKTYFTLALDNLTTTAVDIESLYNDFTGKSLAKIYPILDRCGKIGVDGTFKGLLTDFLATANIKTNQGSLNASLDVTPNSTESVRFIGSLRTSGYNLGSTLSVPTLGNIVFNAKVDATLRGERNSTIKADADIKSLRFADYDYNNLKVNGLFVGKTYRGSITSTDPNCDFETEGFFDLTSEIPAYNFEMTLNNANLALLGFNKRDSVSLLSAKFTANGVGTNIDDINGITSIDRIKYINHIDTVSTNAINIVSENSDSLKTMTLTSDFANIELSGSNSYSEIFRYLSQSIQKYIPSIPEVEEVVLKGRIKKQVKEMLPYKDGSYTLRVDVKKANNIASIFLPGLDVAQGTSLDFYFDPKIDKFSLNMLSDYISLKDDNLQNLVLRSYNASDSIVFRMSSKACELKGMYFPNLLVRGDIGHNKIAVGVDFNNPTDNTWAALKSIATIYRTESSMPQIKVELLPANISFEGNSWDIDPTYALLDSTGIEIRNFKITNQQQELSVNGKLGRNLQDSLVVHLDNFNISPASMLISSLGYRLSGHISGDAKVYSALRHPNFDALLNLDDVFLNDYSLGNPSLIARWDADKRKIDIGVGDDHGNIPIYGYYDVQLSRYWASIKFPKFDLVLLEPLMNGVLTHAVGEADVNLTLSGGKGTPSLDGTVDIKNLDLKVDFTKATYSLAGKVEVKNSCFKLTDVPLTDKLSGKGTVNAFLNTKYFNNLTFGADINFTNLLALNTTILDNDVFYGRAFGTGNFKITGNEHSTNMAITAETALASEFYLPFTGVATIEEANFITFVDPEKKAEQDKPRKTIRRNVSTIQYTNDLDIKIALRVQNNTKAQISMVSDYVGNRIDGRGDGNFTIHINPVQDIFTMNGMYNISRGEYRFNLGGLFDKQLSINPRSSVSWSGNPADPDVNIDAIYKVKTSLEPLTGSIGGYSSSVNVNCGINLSGKLFSPQLKLSITAPAADPETQNILRNQLNTEEAVSNQFFSLFLSNSFIPDMGAASIGSMSGSLAGATGWEFLSNQLSNLISTDKVNIKLGYRPRTQFSSDEVNFDVGLDIIPNKLSLEVGGYYNTGNNPTYNQRSPFSGDAYLTWGLNKQGTLKLKGFTRVIERFDETQGLQESGVGIYFRQDFQSAAELKSKWRAWQDELKRKRMLRKEKRTENP